MSPDTGRFITITTTATMGGPSSPSIVCRAPATNRAAKSALVWANQRWPERHFPMRSGRFVAVKNVPDATQAHHRKTVGETDAHGTPSRLWRAVESDSRLRLCMTAPALARFHGFNSASLQPLD